MDYQSLYNKNKEISKISNISAFTIDRIEKHKIYFKHKPTIPYDLKSIFDYIYKNGKPQGYITNFSLLKTEIEYQNKPIHKRKEYSGKLGNFVYNTNEFQLKTTENGEPYLHYIGVETDGRKIKIPKGIVDCSWMFFHCFLDTAPKIPDGVKICTCMFGGCLYLSKAPEIPNSVIDCDFMFDGCTSLKEAPVIPYGIKYCANMFQETSIIKAPTIPNSVINCSYMFNGCTSLEKAPVIPNSVKNSICMFSYCTNLNEIPTIPKSIAKDKSAGMFVGCSKRIQGIGTYMLLHKGTTFEEAEKALNGYI